jgi:8-oxo-dGTP pyrophosphatase MutT (NUDIX family)
MNLAPNGKPSNLNPEQYRLVRTSAFKAWFGDWESAYETGNYDNVSKVIDKNAEPKVLFHGSPDIDKINVFKSSKGFDYSFFANDFYEALRYTPNGNDRNKVKSFFVNSLKKFDCENLNEKEINDIKKLLNIDSVKEVFFKHIKDIGFSKDSYKEELGYERLNDDDFLFKIFIQGGDNWVIIEHPIIQNYIKSNGYDSFTTLEGDNGNIAVYNPNQIKLSDGTNTTFDSNNPDIRYDEGGRVTFDQYTSQGIKKAYVSIRIRYESGRAADDKFYNKYELKSFDEKPFEELKDHKLKGILGVSTSNYNLSEWLVHRECLVVMPFDKFKELNDTEQIQYYDADYLSKNGFDALHRLFDRKERTDDDYGSVLQNIFPKITQELHLEGMSMSQGSEYTNIYVVADWFNIYNSSKFTKYVANKKRINSPEELAQIVIDYANSEQSKSDYSYNRQTENLSIESIIQPIIRGIVQSGKQYVEESEWLIKNKELVIPENSQLFFVIKDYENMRDKYDEYISRYNLSSSYKIAFINQKNLNELQSKRFNLIREKGEQEFEKAKTFTQKRIVKAIQKIQNDVIEEWTNKLIEEFKESYSNEVFKDYDGNSYSDNILEVPSAIIYFDSLMLKFIDIYDSRVDYIAQSKSKYAFSDIFNDFSDYLDRLISQEGEEELEIQTSYNRIYKYDILQKLYYYARHADYDKFGQQIKSEIGSDLYRYFSKGEVGFKNGGLTMKKVLLAPNGKKSNLNEIQYYLVRTPEFKAWFGDWENSPETASKVVDENGEPLVCYHGTNVIFNEFLRNKMIEGRLGKGFYFTSSKDESMGYGNITMKCFLKVDTLFNGRTRKTIGSGKYFGIEYSLTTNGGRILMVNNPKQIKLADGTNTTFDSNNPDIRYNNGGDIEEPTEFWGESAAGVLLICNKTNRVLLFHRSEDVYEPETWGIISGKIDEDENPKEAILRELIEETKFSEKEVKSIVLKPSYVYKKGSFTFYNYLGFVDSEFTPTLNWENTDYKWCDIGDYPQPLHFGVSLLLKNIDLKKELYKKTIKKKLLAPNGKQSNLNEIQYNLVRTPEFKKWFGDWELLYQYKDRYTYEGHDRLFGQPKIGNEYDLVDGTKAKLLSLDKEKGQYEVLIYGKKQFISFRRMLYLYSGIPDVFTEERLLEISKVVDSNGEPLVVYHATDNKFWEFEKEKQIVGYYGKGFYFSSSLKKSKDYGKRVIPAFLNIKSVFTLSDETPQELLNELAETDFEVPSSPSQLGWREENDIEQRSKYTFGYASKNSDVFMRNLIKNGFYGIKMTYDFKNEINFFIAFEPNQIKLADGTNTTFDSNNPDIRYAKGGELELYHGGQKVFKKFKTNLVDRIDYGWGLYFSDSEEVAKYYARRPFDRPLIFKTIWDSDLSLDEKGDVLYCVRQNLLDIQKSKKELNEKFYPLLDKIEQIVKNKGVVYKVDVEKGRWLDWDKKVPEYIRLMFADIKSEFFESGEDLYNYLSRKEQSEKKASIILLNKGIEGIKYKISNNITNTNIKGYNYVIFDDDYIKVKEVFRYNNGGEFKEVVCSSCGWGWNKHESEEDEIYVCHKCGTDNNPAHKVSLKEEDFGFFKIYLGEKEVGYISYDFNKGLLEIISFFIKSEYRNKGIGTIARKKIVELLKPKEIRGSAVSKQSFKAVIKAFGKPYYMGSVFKQYDDIDDAMNYLPDYAKVDEIEEEIRAGESDGVYYTIKLGNGGSIPDSLSSQQVEYKLGRELHWWNDDIVYLSGIKYKKVYLRPEYKKVIE